MSVASLPLRPGLKVFHSSSLVLSLIFAVSRAVLTHSFCTSTYFSRAEPIIRRIQDLRLFEQNPNNENDDNDSIDEFLDTPFFDPEKVKEDDPLPVKWYANLVKNDYNTAEALYVGVIFVLMVVLSQELLRMQIYGNNYVPFQRGVQSGKLF